MTKLPGKSHSTHAHAAAKEAAAVSKPDADDKAVDALADAIEEATEKAVADWLKPPAPEADAPKTGGSSAPKK